MGEAEAIRAIGQAKSEAYRVGVESLGTREFTALQLMQIIGDVQANGGGNGAGGGGLVEALIGLLVRAQNEPLTEKSTPTGPAPAAPQEPVS